MQFSFGFGVSLMCVTLLLFLPARGNRQHVFQKPPKRATIAPTCCTQVSAAQIRDNVVACFEQREYLFANCRIHAYIFRTRSGKTFCVDPNARWLPKRLQKLQAKGIFCKTL